MPDSRLLWVQDTDVEGLGLSGSKLLKGGSIEDYIGDYRGY